MFRFRPLTIPSQIFVIGCGGTGSRLVPLLTQFIASISKDKNPRGWLDNPTIFLVDDDVIESKNLLRQNFVSSDVGKHKATVLAQRYGKAYGVNVIPILKRVTGDYNELIQDVPGDPDFRNSMIIMCVDTAGARRAIINTVNSRVVISSPGQGPFFIDAGNEDNFGQIRFFNYAIARDSSGTAEKLELPKLSPSIIDIPAIPLDTVYYDRLSDMPGQGSCADLDQTLAINALMATLVMGIVQNYYYVKPMTFNQISVSLDGAVLTSFNTPTWLQKLMAQGNTSTPRLSTRRILNMNVDPYLTKFVKETEIVMTKIQPSVETKEGRNKKEENSEAVSTPAPRRRPRSKKAESNEAVEKTVTLEQAIESIQSVVDDQLRVSDLTPTAPTLPTPSLLPDPLPSSTQDDIPF
jgi:hypothetical protein